MIVVLGALAVAIVPGALLALVVPPGREQYVALAASPVLTLGLVSVASGWLGLAGLPDSPGWVLVVELLVGGGAALGGWWWRRGGRTRRRGTPAGSWTRPTRLVRLPAKIDLLAMAAAGVVVLGFGHVLVGRFRFPPGWDANNHAILTRNMLQSGSTDITAACRTGSFAGRTACQFYPIAADITWGQAAWLTGGRLSASMVAAAAVVGPVALVAAIYAAVRLLGGRPVAAACAAALPAVIGTLWQQQIGSPIQSRVSGVIPGFSIAVALLVVLALRGRFRTTMAVLAGLSVTGLAMTHTYDVLFAATLALAFLIFFTGYWRLRAAVTSAAVLLVSTLVTIAPFLPSMVGANGERTALPAPFAGRLGDAFQYWVTDLQRYALFGWPDVHGHQSAEVIARTTIQIGLVITVPLLVLSVACIPFAALAWARPWLAAGIVWTAIGIWTTSSTDGLAQALAHLWYGGAPRLTDMVFPVYPVLTVAGACALGLGAQYVLSRLFTATPDSGRRLRGQPVVALAVPVVLVVTLLGVGALPSSRRGIQHELAARAPAGGAFPRVLAWVDQHTAPGEAVAYNRTYEWLTWSFGDYGTRALFGVGPFDPPSTQDIAQRWRAYEFLTGQPGAEPAGCLVRRFHVAWLVTSNRHLTGGVGPEYSHAGAATSPYLQLAHSDGGLRVYRVTEAGRVCAGA